MPLRRNSKQKGGSRKKESQEAPTSRKPEAEAPLVAERVHPHGAAPRRTGLALAITFVFCAAFYLWTADAFRLPWLQRKGEIYFAMLADGFLHGQTSLLVKPRPELLALPDPYDPDKNGPYKIHDASLYHGKYYFYWGVSPTLLWYLPVRALTGLSGSDTAACSIFSIAGLLFYFLLLYEIRRDHFPNSSVLTTIFVGLLLAFGNVVPFTLRRQLAYESAILCGYMLTAAFLYFIYAAAFRDELKSGYLVASGVALALAFLCRPFLAACGLATVAGLWMYRRSESKAVRWLAISLGPSVAAVAAQAWYNYVRFDSPFEFGFKYQLSSKAISGFFAPHRIPFGTLTYLFTLPKLAPFFPFIKATSDPASQPLKLLAGILTKHANEYGGVEAVTGFLFCVPLFILYVLGLFFLKDRETQPGLKVFLVAIVTGELIVFLFDLASYYTTMRYEVDFVPGLLFPVAALALWLDQRSVLFRTILPVFVIYTVVVSALLSITGYYGGLQYSSPGQFNFLTKVFVPIERHAGPQWTTFGGVHAKITPPKCESGTNEALVATGIPGEGDVISFQCTAGQGKLAVAWDHHWAPRTMGSVFAVAPSQPMDIEIETPALYPRLPAIAEMIYYPGVWSHIPKSCVVRVNGAEVFRKDACEMYGSTSKTTYLFKNGIGMAGVAWSYSGSVLSVQRVPPK